MYEIKDTDLTEQEEQELYEHYRFSVDKGQGLLRIDKYLTARIENASRNKIQQAADAGCILVNGKNVKSNYKVKPLDVVSIVMATPPREIELVPQNLPLNIVFEDNDVIVVNKESGMVVHPAYGNYTGTLMNALVFHFQHLPLLSSAPRKNAEQNAVRPGLIHRIDKNTSGLLVIAKNEKAMTLLAKEFYERTIQRTYIALVWGNIKEELGTITGNVGRHPKDRKIMDVFPDGEHGKHAVTHYKVLERFRYVSLVECKLETGRTHQIRVHFQHIGHPLFNDETYGGNKIIKGTASVKYRQFIENCFALMPRHALHAKSLGFVHPETKKNIFFDSELPADFQAVIEKWKKLD